MELLVHVAFFPGHDVWLSCSDALLLSLRWNLDRQNTQGLSRSKDFEKWSMDDYGQIIATSHEFSPQMVA